jgi:ssDNA-binding replication factor A large subunit
MRFINKKVLLIDMINTIEPNTGNINITAKVIDTEEPRIFNKFGKEGKVQNVRIKDETGTTTLVLWNEQITDDIKPNIDIEIMKGYAKEYNNEIQITLGKFGKMNIKKFEK